MVKDNTSIPKCSVHREQTKMCQCVKGRNLFPNFESSLYTISYLINRAFLAMALSIKCIMYKPDIYQTNITATFASVKYIISYIKMLPRHAIELSLSP
jgi:hypothetical protein